ncbi:FAD binding domain-containing protein [Mesobacillus maritimus]|uniref:FAD binding domain-containing protein n=1 Tax=Mesobacillus maritimus TaxID=1643336 RepID=A0ABS7KAV4_9BACI|nr:FAD binding domain-containing protein [Mesobacillus maritimus]MBY0099384.1 FAD binding domain-containing protein [Mesobacillus maritimus]
MLPFSFEYERPKSFQEAVTRFQQADQSGKEPMYISGATEFLTLGRINQVYTEAAIDVKGIPEGKVIQFDQGYLVLGANLTLTELEEANVFPLLTSTSKQIADHTARGKITLGGNICGQIFYREAVLPLLLADSQMVMVGPEGVKVKPINEIFYERLLLQKGEFLIQVATDTRYLHAPFISIKRRQQWDTGYPLITIAALKIDRKVRVAISGLCPFPFRSNEMEDALNNLEGSPQEKIQNALASIPSPILDDVEGSSEYRLFVLQNLLLDVYEALKFGERE